MPMKNPPHPGEMIGDSLEAMNISISDAAKALGVTRQQLHNLIAGRCAIMPEMAYRLEKAVGSTADAWLRMQANWPLSPPNGARQICANRHHRYRAGTRRLHLGNGSGGAHDDLTALCPALTMAGKVESRARSE